MAGILYLGSGIGLALVSLMRARRASAEAQLRGSDWWWLAGSVVFGGIAGPVLFLCGLALATAATASLLLNLEAVATALIAWLIFREHASRRTVAGMALILAGAVVLTWSGVPAFAAFAGPLAIAGACVAWALDNNLMRKLSGRDPVRIAAFKSLAAGSVNLILATLVVRAVFPPGSAIFAAALVGFFGYGVSLVLYVLALRHIGTARTAAYFSSAPFLGAAIAIAGGSARAERADFRCSRVHGGRDRPPSDRASLPRARA